MTEAPFEFHRTPLAHQLRDFERFKNDPYFGLFYEQRGRKTKVVLDIFRYRYLKGDVSALVVIAYPNGVHRVWLDELPKDFPPDFLEKTKSLAWRTSRMRRGSAEEQLDELLFHNGPVVLTLNCESIISDTTLVYLRKFYKKHRVFTVADEASWAARWSKRTRKLLQIGRSSTAKIKAILDGTPVDEGPGDIFYPTQFLKKGLLGFPTREAFRSRYTAYEMEEVEPGVFERKKGYNRKTNTEFDIVLGTRNLDELHDKLKGFSSRVLRSEVSDAPPKTYQTRYFQLTEKQRSFYDKLRKEFLAELTTQTMPVANVLARMTRLQMVARNYYPPTKTGIVCPDCAYGYLDTGDECSKCDGLGIIVRTSELERIDKTNPAADALVAELIATRGPVVIWCRFRQDVLDVMDAIKRADRKGFRYDGGIPETEREKGYQAFRLGIDPKDTIAATLKSGLTRGKDLTRADLLCFYTNEFSLRVRQQSEDRAESLSRTHSTDIVDLVAEDTRDLDVIEAHREKKSIASIIMGDPSSLI